MLSSDLIELRELTSDDVSEAYVSWLNDPGTNRYMGCSRFTSTLESVREYVTTFAEARDRWLFGVFVAATGAHVGNITLQDLEPTDLRAEIGVLIGDPASRGKGLGTEAIRLVCGFAFGEVGLHKVTAGVVDGNEASLRAFEKAGFSVEGVLREQFRLGDGWRDVHRLGLLASEVSARSGEVPA